MVLRRMSWALFVSIVFVGCSVRDQLAAHSFTYLGKLIHPSRIETLYNSENKTSSLKTLETKSNFREWKRHPHWLITGYDQDVEAGKAPFFAYKFLANVQDRFLLLIKYNGGGTGIFDNILVIQKTKDRLFLLEALGEGDRCNGGISEGKTVGAVFYYSRNLTPIDIIRLATEVKIDLTAYEDLEASAISCFGVAHYKYDMVDDKNKLLAISLDEEKQDEEGWTDRYQAQSCFNKIYNSYIKAKKTELSLKDLNEFVKKFKDQCLLKQHPVNDSPLRMSRTIDSRHDGKKTKRNGPTSRIRPRQM